TSTTFQSLASASALIFLSCVSTVQRSPLRSMEARTYAATSFVFLSATSSTMQPSLRERVLQPRYVLAHVDDSGPDLDAGGPCRYRREQSNRRCRLFGEVVDAEVRPVDADLIGADADLHCLLQRFPRAVGAAGGVMTETQESECLHAHTNLVECSIIPTGLPEPDPVRRLGLGSPGPSP